MVFRELTGKYSELGVWWDTSGMSGPLEGSVLVEFAEDRLTFRYEDGEVQIIGPLVGEACHAAIQGEKSAGTLYVGDNCLVLEYQADVNGREERNTDTWTFFGEIVRRSGLIRQADRIIWFEAEMVRS